MEQAITKKLLIVEDEPMIRHAMVEFFSTKKDIIVLAAKDGTEGLESALREHPDLIILDMVMPGMDGIDVLTALRDDPWGEKAKVMFLTNQDDPEKVAEAHAKGVYEFVLKSSMDVKELVEQVHKKMFEKP